MAVLCIDNETIKTLLPRISRPYQTYGLSEGADFQVCNIEMMGTQTKFELRRPAKAASISFTLNLPGKHNVLNAVAATIIALQLDVQEHYIQEALRNFQGIARRFQTYPEVCINGKNIQLVDDYGHHPTELAATIKAARDAYPEQRLVVLFQPQQTLAFVGTSTTVQ